MYYDIILLFTLFFILCAGVGIFFLFGFFPNQYLKFINFWEVNKSNLLLAGIGFFWLIFISIIVERNIISLFSMKVLASIAAGLIAIHLGLDNLQAPLKREK